MDNQYGTPAQPARRSNNTMIIAVVAILVLCCCCLAVTLPALWACGDFLMGTAATCSF
jgi:hypothetical protein